MAELDLLQRRVDELQRQLEQERRDHDAQLSMQREEVRRLKDELEESFREFTQLMNTKIALDQEILMYRKMLEGEESRYASLFSKIASNHADPPLYLWKF